MRQSRTSWQRDEIVKRIEDLGPWFHNMELGGIMTAPEHFLGDYPSFKWNRFQEALPRDLHGMTVLDVGCNAGFYALEMKRRGADRVVGIDSDPRSLQQAGLAADVLGLDIELQRMSVYDVADLGERFDLVLFMGVLYHLRYPLYALDLLREHVVGDSMVFQNRLRGDAEIAEGTGEHALEERSIFDRPGHPRMSFIEHRHAGEPSNRWIPNRACVEAMLRSAGFSIEAHPEEEVYICRVAHPRKDEP